MYKELCKYLSFNTYVLAAVNGIGSKKDIYILDDWTQIKHIPTHFDVTMQSNQRVLMLMKINIRQKTEACHRSYHKNSLFKPCKDEAGERI